MPSSQAIMFLARKRRGGRQAFSEFAELVATPFDLGSAAAGNFLDNTLTLPGRLPFGLGVAHSAGMAAGEVQIEVNGESVPTRVRAGIADQIVPVAFGSGKGAQIRVLGAEAGDVTLYFRDQLGRYFAFATGTLT